MSKLGDVLTSIKEKDAINTSTLKEVQTEIMMHYKRISKLVQGGVHPMVNGSRCSIKYGDPVIIAKGQHTSDTAMGTHNLSKGTKAIFICVDDSQQYMASKSHPVRLWTNIPWVLCKYDESTSNRYELLAA